MSKTSALNLTDSTGSRGSREHTASRQAYLVLRSAFTIAPILFGVDKFFHVMTDWGRYLAPPLADLSPFTLDTTMYLVGGVEVVAGLVVAVRPRLGAPLVAVWLAGIIVNLIVLGGHLDIALRDVGLLLAAVALSLLSRAHDVSSTAQASPLRAEL